MGKRIGCAFMGVVFLMFAIAACGAGNTPVPDVFGRTIDQARVDLETVGLRLGDVRYDASASGATGRVIDQSPDPELLVKDGRRISIVISGPELVQVPYMRGEQQSSARLGLSSARLERGPIMRVNDNYAPEGEVLDQNPPGGRWVPKGTQVSMTVSDGPETANVPGVTGLQELDARGFLYDVGLRPYVTEEHANRVEGYVIEQFPHTRTEVVLGETVELVVSAGPPPVRVPDVRGMNERDAENELEDSGLEVSYAPGDRSGKRADRYVYSQVPYPGAVIPEGSGVTLRIRVLE